MKPALREWLQDGPFTLALSAGFFGFFAHAGFLAALEDAALVPEKVCGSSAGALVGGIWASGASGREIAEELFTLRRAEFWDPAPGFGLLKGERFLHRLRSALRVRTFGECRAPLAISVFEARERRTEVLREGELAAAIRASCSLPVLFQPTLIGGHTYVDGGVIDRPGIAGAQGDARVLVHYLPSRSPWRVFYKPAQVPAAVEGRVIVATQNLPRVGPFSLEVGRRAFEAARLATQRALENS